MVLWPSLRPASNRLVPPSDVYHWSTSLHPSRSLARRVVADSEWQATGLSAPGQTEPGEASGAPPGINPGHPPFRRGNARPGPSLIKGVPAEPQVSSRRVAGVGGAAGRSGGAQPECFGSEGARAGRGGARQGVRCWEPSPRPGARPPLGRAGHLWWWWLG